MAYDLDFEKPLADLDKRINALQKKGDRLKPDEQTQLRDLKNEIQHRTRDIYQHLNGWQTVQVARHKDRPYAADYIKMIFNEFFELHGDRRYGDDHAIMAGPATLDGQTVMLICQQKGRDVKEKQYHNYGMPHPEGYRKTARLMEQAEKFGFPIICLIDTQGAFPGLGAEERGQSESIASNLALMFRIKTPIIAAVIGEGGSGGALAISIADRVLMLEHSIYTVVAPEAAANILWRDKAFAAQAADAMKITANNLKDLGLIDRVVAEPLGGAHRDSQEAANNLKRALQETLADLREKSTEDLVEQRYEKYRHFDQFATI